MLEAFQASLKIADINSYGYSDPVADPPEPKKQNRRAFNPGHLQTATESEPLITQRNPMNIPKILSFVSISILSFSMPAFAAVTVNSPVNGADVDSPFKLSAIATVCSSQPVASMGYSLDGSSDTTVINGTSVETSVVSGAGTHTVHVKSWGDQGASCVTDVEVKVQTAATSSSLVPSDATSVSSIQAFGGWKASNDSGGKGNSSGSMGMVSSPSQSGSARKFVTSFSNNGDERYSISFGDDQSATNFLYDGWVYLTSSAGNVANLEMDLNQVMSNGQTVIYGFQCDGWYGTWDYTKNEGTPAKPKDAWIHSKAACNPHSWKVNAWHHVQISYSRNDSGVVTYKSVWLDDVEQKINATVPSSFALGWGASLLVNFQVDGKGVSGSNTVYLDKLTVYRW